MIGYHLRRNILLNKAGQGSLEFVATLPLYLLLFFLLLYFGLYLWLQIIASVALHDGVRVTAETGNVVVSTMATASSSKTSISSSTTITSFPV